MEEEKFVEEQIENINVAEIEETVVPIVDETMVLSAQNKIIEANIEEAEVLNVTINEDVGPHALKIVSDHAFGLPRQHSIGAIEGLREELDDIERLTTVYSDSVNQANYYMWRDENPKQENRDGYFVSVHQDDNKIYLCKAADDEFGVTVSSAGFVGNQNEEMPRGSNYALVVHSGLVGVRCKTDVVQGDYVVSDDYGMAQKTNGTYGYLVTAISNIDGVRHAIISLTIPTTQMQKFAETTQDVSDRMDSAEVNIATAISVANAAYNKAQVAQDWVQGNVENMAGQVGDISGKVDDVVSDVDGLKDSVAGATILASQAHNIASQSEATISNIKTYVNAELNDAHTTINNLTDAVAPITTWTGYDENGAEVEGASYFVQHIDKNFLETKTQIETVQTLTEENQTAISRNAENIQLLATSIDEYSVGEWSQAYGLTLSQAWSILNPGMIYIPTPATHDEKYKYSIVDKWDEQYKDRSMIYRAEDTDLYWRSVVKKDENDNLTNQWESVDLTTTDGDVYIIEDTQSFTRGYYYAWNGFYWVESEYPYVYFSAKYVLPSEECQYWYRDTNDDLVHDGITYKAHGLYMIINDKWTEVNIIDGNITNRVASMIDQTANSISLDVSNARGDVAALSAKIDDQSSQVAMVAAKSEPSDIELSGEVDSFEKLPTDAQNGVYYAVGQKVYRYNGVEWKEQYHLAYDGVYVKKINAANIIAAVNNEGDSSIGINADKIIMTGTTTFLRPADVGPDGTTTIDGSRITTGTIASNDGTVKIDLGRGTAGISGKVTATSGYIGDKEDGFTIDRVTSYAAEMSDGLDNSLLYYTLKDDIYYCFRSPKTFSDSCDIKLSEDCSYVEIAGNETLLRVNIQTSDTIPYHPDINSYEFALTNDTVYYIPQSSFVEIFTSQNTYIGFKILMNDGSTKVIQTDLGNNSGTCLGMIYSTLVPGCVYAYRMPLGYDAKYRIDWVSAQEISGYDTEEKSAVSPMQNVYYCECEDSYFKSSQEAQFKFGELSYYHINIPQIIWSTDEWVNGIIYMDQPADNFPQFFILGRRNMDSITVLGQYDNPVRTQELTFTHQTNFAIYNNQTSLIGNTFGDKGIYISKNGIGLGNGRFHINNDGNVMIVSKFNEDGTPYDYSVYNSKGQMRFINGIRVPTYNMSIVCDGYDGSTTGTVQAYDIQDGAGSKVSTYKCYTIFYCVGEYWYQLAQKYNDSTTTDEQRRQMLNMLILDNTTAVKSVYETSAVETIWAFNQIKPVDVGTQYGYGLIDSKYKDNLILTSDFRGAVIEYYSQSDYQAYFAIDKLSDPSWHNASAPSKLSCIINSTMDV